MNKIVKRSLKIAGGIFAGLLTLVIIALLVVAYKGGAIAKQYLEEHDKELIGRELNIGNIDLSLLHGSVKIDSVCLKEKDGKTDFVNFDSLYVSLKLADLFDNKVNLEHIHLDGANVRVLQRDSVFNFTDIIEHFSKKDTTETKKDDSDTTSKWEIGLNDIQLRRCNVLYKDLVLNSKFDLQNVNIGIPGIYFSNKSTDVGLNLNFDNGGSLKAQMKYDVATSVFEITTQIKSFSIEGVKPYMQQGVRVGSVAGLLDVDAKMTGDFNHIMNFNLSGKSSLRNVNVTDDLGRLVLSAKRTSAELVRLNLTDNEIHLGVIDGEGIASQFLIDKSGNNNISYFVSSPGTEQAKERKEERQEAKADKEQKPLKFIIDKVDMRGLSMHMEDASLTELFTYDVKDFCVSAKNVTLDNANDVTMSCRMGKTGTMQAQWKGRLTDINNQNLSATLSNIDLSEFTPYFAPILAYRITGGNLTLVSQNIIDNGNLNGTNKLSVMNWTVEKDEKVENPEVKVPLKTALYVIKDKNGKIDIDLPVSGNINSPEFSYKKIIVKTLLNFLAKVGTSPFKALGKIFGSSDDANKANLNPTSSALEVESYDLLNKVVDMVKQKPELKAKIEQQINYDDAIEDMALLKLKTAFYLKQNPGKTEANLELIDKDAISKITNKDEAFSAYVASVATNGETKLEKVAMSLYGTSAQSSLAQLATKRTSDINTYLNQQLGAKATNVSVVAEPYNADTKYSGKSLLKIDLVEE